MSETKKTENPLKPAKAEARAGEFYDAGQNCCEAMLSAFSESRALADLDQTTLKAVATGLGKGMGKAEGTCGAFTAAAMIISAHENAHHHEARKIYRAEGAFSKRFLKHFGSLRCKDLLKDSPHSCREKTAIAAGMLAEYLNKLG